MSLPQDAEDYLRRVRQSLSSIDSAEREEIVKELRTHVLDRQTQGKTDLLAGFDSVEVLAASFLSEYELRGALARGTSWRLGRSLLVAAQNSVLALFVLLPLVLAQIAGACFILIAALMPFLPGRAGLWLGPEDFFVGVNTSQPRAHELLGLWGIPVFSIAGVLLFWITNRAMRALVRRRLQSFKSRPLS